MRWDHKLFGKPLAIAQWPGSRLRVMAGPGTGKSFAMKRRVARLLQEGVPAKRIMAVTFTRNAAASLTDDLHALDVIGCDYIQCGTPHSFCFGLLHREEAFAFSGRTPRPLVTFNQYGGARFEAEPMIADLCRTPVFGGKRGCNKRLLAFEAAWARLQSDAPGWASDPVDEAFESELLNWLRFHQCMLIGEVVPESLKYLRSNPGCPVLIDYDHVIVDEYQDLNKAEQALLDLLARHGSLAVVGDVDQSIYSFRHANPEGITDFATARPATARPATHDESLDECRRCPRRVVRLAAHLIKHNHPPGTSARLVPEPSKADGEVHVVQWPSFEAEAAGLSRYIKSLVDDGHPPEEVLVLTPRRLIGYAIRDALAGLGVPVHSFYQEEVLEDDRAQEAFCTLSLLVDPDDRPALRWWLGYGSDSWRRGAYARLRGHCEATGLSPRAALDQLLAGTLKLAGTSKLIDRYATLNGRLAPLAGAPVGSVVDALFPDGQAWALGLREIATADAPADGTPSDLKDRITTGVTQPEMPTGGEFVRVMSLHKSKGLTSRTVIIAGCIEGYIPFVSPDETPVRQADLLREQRRLFYVAITRCTDRLVLSSARQLDLGVAFNTKAVTTRTGGTRPSRFLTELGPDLPDAVHGDQWEPPRTTE